MDPVIVNNWTNLCLKIRNIPCNGHFNKEHDEPWSTIGIWSTVFSYKPILVNKWYRFITYHKFSYKLMYIYTHIMDSCKIKIMDIFNNQHHNILIWFVHMNLAQQGASQQMYLFDVGKSTFTVHGMEHNRLWGKHVSWKSW